MENNNKITTFERIKINTFDYISPGSLHGNRVAVGDDLDEIFIATSNKILSVNPTSSPSSSDMDIESSNTYEKGYAMTSVSSKDEILNFEYEHNEEICNLIYKKDSTNHKSILYSIDMKGNAFMNVLSPSSNSFEDNKNSFKIGEKQYQCSNSLKLMPSLFKLENQLWCGIDSSPINPNKIVTSLHLNKNVTLYDEERIIRSFKLIQNPSRLLFIDDNILSITENNSVSFIDLRMKSFYVKRIQPYSGYLYAMHHSDHLLGVGGYNRSIAVIDTRKMSIISHWSSSLKYEITHILFSSLDNNLCFVSGLDSEILCGRWDGSSNLSHFDGPRVESRWIGLTQDKKTDSIIGYTEQGYCYIIKNGINLMNMAKNK